jgi:uncharacterized protein (TIGR03083 family)
MIPPLAPCYTAHLFRPLDGELIGLLRSLAPGEWARQTAAPRWTVRDVAAHLLDVTLRRVAVSRDNHFAPADRPPANDRELTALVNALNAGGVAYSARLSPRLIVDLLEVSCGWLADVIEALPPHGQAVFAVSWAGEAVSENWMDIGREYTEHWHHQMQIRDAASRPPALLEPRWMAPLLDISLRALPHSYRDVVAPRGTAITLIVEGPTSGAWTLARGDRAWRIGSGEHADAAAVIRVAADVVWRILYNAPFDRGQVRIEGDAALAAPLLNTRSVIV